MAAVKDPTLDEGYVRRLDRTPENDGSNLARMTQDDRKRIYGLRAVFETAKDRMQRLEEEVDTKERSLEKEKLLRQSLEDKLQKHLVDMYKNPALNDELHRRLPRSSRQRRRRSAGDSGGRRRQSHSPYRSGSEERSRDDTTSNRHRNRRRHRSCSSEDSHHDERSRGGHHHSYPMYSTPTHHGYYGYPPPMFIPPFNSEGESSYFPMHPPFTGPPGFHPSMHPAPSTAPGSPGKNTSFAKEGKNAANPSTGEAASGPMDESTTELLKLKASSLFNDQTAQIKRLLQELNHFKDQNRRLSEELAESQNHVNRLNMKNELKAADIEAQISSRAAALINEVYSAQKNRDEAVMGRLRIANKERDEALKRLHGLQAKQDSWDFSGSEPEDESESRNLDKLLHAIHKNSSPSNVRRKAADIVDVIHGSIAHRNQTHSEEIQTIIEERDLAVEKCKQLQQEVLTMQRSALQHSATSRNEENLKKKLLATQNERDMALSKQSKLEEELQTLRVYYSLHKSLSQESMLRDQYNNSLERLELALAEKEGWVQTAKSVNNRLSAQLRGLTSEREVLKDDLDKTENKSKEAAARADKYQRLVTVLQRKLKTGNTSNPAQDVIGL